MRGVLSCSPHKPGPGVLLFGNGEQSRLSRTDPPRPLRFSLDSTSGLVAHVRGQHDINTGDRDGSPRDGHEHSLVGVTGEEHRRQQAADQREPKESRCPLESNVGVDPLQQTDRPATHAAPRSLMLFSLRRTPPHTPYSLPVRVAYSWHSLCTRQPSHISLAARDDWPRAGKNTDGSSRPLQRAFARQGSS